MKTDVERFMEAFEAVPESGCWLWTGCWTERGYGQFWFGGRLGRAHRFSFDRFVRPLGASEVVCHRCDTPACVNPHHLFAGSQVENLRDCVEKGRKETRERSDLYRGAMTLERAREIRRRRETGESNRSIASALGISEAYCSTVARGIHWPEAA